MIFFIIACCMNFDDLCWLNGFFDISHSHILIFNVTIMWGLQYEIESGWIRKKLQHVWIIHHYLVANICSLNRLSLVSTNIHEACKTKTNNERKNVSIKKRKERKNVIDDKVVNVYGMLSKKIRYVCIHQLIQ